MYVCITDVENGMKYVGQTFDTRHRLLDHRRSGPFSTLLKEKGFASIEFEILEQDVDVDDADDRERHYVTQFNTLEPNGYNKITGGKKGGNLSVSCSAAVGVRNKELFENEDHKYKHKTSLNAPDVQKRRSTNRKLHYDEKIKQLLPQFKMYIDEYKRHGSMKTIINLMNISQTVYYRLLEEARRVYIVS